MPRREQQRRVEKVLGTIAYLQDRRRQAARIHRKRRLRQLHARGIQISRLPKCFGLF
jgi:hypothetical protein